MLRVRLNSVCVCVRSRGARAALQEKRSGLGGGRLGRRRTGGTGDDTRRHPVKIKSNQIKGTATGACARARTRTGCSGRPGRARSWCKRARRSSTGTRSKAPAPPARRRSRSRGSSATRRRRPGRSPGRRPGAGVPGGCACACAPRRRRAGVGKRRRRRRRHHGRRLPQRGNPWPLLAAVGVAGRARRVGAGSAPAGPGRRLPRPPGTWPARMVRHRCRRRRGAAASSSTSRPRRRLCALRPFSSGSSQARARAVLAPFDGGGTRCEQPFPSCLEKGSGGGVASRRALERARSVSLSFFSLSGHVPTARARGTSPRWMRLSLCVCLVIVMLIECGLVGPCGQGALKKEEVPRALGGRRAETAAGAQRRGSLFPIAVPRPCSTHTQTARMHAPGSRNLPT